MDYVVLVPTNASNLSKPSSNPVGGGIKLAAKAMRWLHDFGFEKKVKSSLESEPIKGTVKLNLPNNEGVLIEVNYCEWKQPDFTGFRAKSYQSAYFVGAGENPESVLRKYLSNDRLYGGLGEDWILKHIYLWIPNEKIKRNKLHYDHNLQTLEKITRTC